VDPKLEQLLRSRKLWAATLIMATSMGLYALGEIDAVVLASLVAVSGGVYMGSVALEDGLSAALGLWMKAAAQDMRMHEARLRDVEMMIATRETESLKDEAERIDW
jgi:hypothetical protein